MGIISAAMAAAGNSGVESMNQRIDQMNRQELMDKQAAINSDSDQRRAELEVWKANAIEQLRNAPVNRFQDIVNKQAAEQTPVDAKPVTELTQDSADKTGLASGIQGNMDVVNAITKQAQDTLKNPQATDEQRTNAQGIIDQLSSQISNQQQVNQEAVAGQTRSKTPEEILDASINYAKLHDPQAYAKAAELGLVQPKLTKIGQNETLVDNKGKVIFSNTAGAEAEEKRQDRMDARLQAQIEAADKRNADRLEALQKRGEFDPDIVEKNANAIATGRMPPLTGYALRAKGGPETMARVFELNPDYSAKDYKVQAKAEADFGTGKLGNSVRSFNVSLAHLQTLEGLADALNNKDTQMLNKLGNAFATQTGQAAPTNFNAVKHIVADEIVKAVTGSAGALGDREAAAKTIDAANSPEQLKGVIASYKELMNGQLNGLRDQYRIATGKDDFDKYLSDTAKQVNSNSTHTPIKAPTDYGKPKPAAAQQGGVKFLGFE